MINNILEFMKEDNYGKWCKRLKGYTPSQIHDAIKISSKKKCPPAYFNYLLKNKMIWVLDFSNQRYILMVCVLVTKKVIDFII